jgi:hypothetical protein
MCLYSNVLSPTLTGIQYFDRSPSTSVGHLNAKGSIRFTPYKAGLPVPEIIKLDVTRNSRRCAADTAFWTLLIR